MCLIRVDKRIIRTYLRHWPIAQHNRDEWIISCLFQQSADFFLSSILYLAILDEFSSLTCWDSNQYAIKLTDIFPSISEEFPTGYA